MPYWDSSLDGDLPAPEDSIMFSEYLLGEPDSGGFVTNGLFANWTTMDVRLGICLRINSKILCEIRILYILSCASDKFSPKRHSISFLNKILRNFFWTFFIRVVIPISACSAIRRTVSSSARVALTGCSRRSTSTAWWPSPCRCTSVDHCCLLLWSVGVRTHPPGFQTCLNYDTDERFLEYSHDYVHYFISGDMQERFSSSNDPIFFMHHGNRWSDQTHHGNRWSDQTHHGNGDLIWLEIGDLIRLEFSVFKALAGC